MERLCLAFTATLAEQQLFIKLPFFLPGPIHIGVVATASELLCCAHAHLIPPAPLQTTPRLPPPRPQCVPNAARDIPTRRAPSARPPTRMAVTIGSRNARIASRAPTFLLPRPRRLHRVRRSLPRYVRRMRLQPVINVHALWTMFSSRARMLGRPLHLRPSLPLPPLWHPLVHSATIAVTTPLTPRTRRPTARSCSAASRAAQRATSKASARAETTLRRCTASNRLVPLPTMAIVAPRSPSLLAPSTTACHAARTLTVARAHLRYIFSPAKSAPTGVHATV